MSQSATIVQRLWNYCNVLRDDGISYGDYLEQLNFLLFLKMDQERVQELGESTTIPADLSWASLTNLDGDPLESHYRHILTELGKGSGPHSGHLPQGPKSHSRPGQAQAAGQPDRWRNLVGAGY